MEHARDLAIEILARDGAEKSGALAHQLLGVPIVEAVERD